MKKIWLLYYSKYIKKNQHFINEMTAEGRRNNLDIRLVTVEELSHIKDKERPYAVISRVINPALSKRLEDSGLKLFNNFSVSRLCNNKAETINRVHELGIVHIPTITVTKKSKSECLTSNCAYSYSRINSPNLYRYNNMLDMLTNDVLNDILLGLKSEFGAIDLSKYVIKSVTGHGGQEVMLLSEFYMKGKRLGEQESDAQAFYKDKYVIQPLMSEYTSDIRIYVVGGRIIGAVKRHVQNDFKSNYSLGGQVSLFEADEYMRKCVDNILALSDFSYIGIDFLYSEGKTPVFNEIEDVVGARMLSECGVNDYAEKYIKYISENI